jgi:hypothetical protein
MCFLIVGFRSIGQKPVSSASDSLSKPDANKDTLSKPAAKNDSSGFDKFNTKAEHLFKILPVPIYSYSPEAGNIFGLAKFNVFSLSKKDTVSKPSKLSGVFTASTLGRINASIATQLVFDQDKYVIISYVNYKKEPNISGILEIRSPTTRQRMKSTGLYLQELP